MNYLDYSVIITLFISILFINNILIRGIVMGMFITYLFTYISNEKDCIYLLDLYVPEIVGIIAYYIGEYIINTNSKRANIILSTIVCVIVLAVYTIIVRI